MMNCRSTLQRVRRSMVKAGLIIMAGSMALFIVQCSLQEEVAIPVIAELLVSPDTVDIGRSAWLECVLEQELEEELTYRWAASDGWFQGEGSMVNWNAPLVEGEYTISCTVEDDRENADSAAVVLTVEAQEHPAGHWIVRAPMPTTRQELSAVVLTNKIYLVGGMNANGSPMARVEAYDPVTNTWEAKAPLPTPRHHVALTTLGGKLYAVGGVSSTVPIWTGERQVYEYDPEQDAWRRVTNMPSNRIEPVAIGFEGRIYVIGGRIGTSRVATNEAYDVATGSWRTLAPAPVPISHSAVAAVDSCIYVVGGRDGMLVEGVYEVVNSRRLQEYHPASDTWRIPPSMPTARGGLAAAVMDGVIYVFGGENLGSVDVPATVYNATEAYDPLTSSWKILAPMLTPRHGMGAAALDGIIYVIGGGIEAAIGPSDINEGFIP
ncbi:MAG: hypothetical protein JSW54_11765 [Fidelibacterota bacterium]|nr:MAG: hypothetical protein JSW54_11765 [Candidatus Neomarinimicrobiota bacterium]